MDLVDKYLGELTKKQVFGVINKALAGGDWMDIDSIAKKAVGFPMSKMGIEAHIRELVRKGKAKESIKKGKAIYKISENIYEDSPKKMKEVKVDLVLSVHSKFGQKSEFRKALKNLLNARGASVMSLKAIKSIDGLV
jgi:putative cell wall-binding protein